MPGDKTKFNKWRLPLVVGALVVLAIVGAVGVGVLLAHDRQATPVAFASSTPSPSPSPHGDTHSRRACELNDELSSEDLFDAQKIQAVFDEADQSKDFDIKLAAQHLYDARKVASAERARGGNDLSLALASLSASIDMKTTCLNLGYYQP